MENTTNNCETESGVIGALRRSIACNTKPSIDYVGNVVAACLWLAESKSSWIGFSHRFEQCKGCVLACLSVRYFASFCFTVQLSDK